MLTASWYHVQAPVSHCCYWHHDIWGKSVASVLDAQEMCIRCSSQAPKLIPLMPPRNAYYTTSFSGAHEFAFASTPPGGGIACNLLLWNRVANMAILLQWGKFSLSTSYQMRNCESKLLRDPSRCLRLHSVTVGVMQQDCKEHLWGKCRLLSYSKHRIVPRRMIEVGTNLGRRR